MHVIIAHGQTRLLVELDEPNPTVFSLKRQIGELLPIEPECQILRYNGQPLRNLDRIRRHGILNGSEITLIVYMRLYLDYEGHEDDVFVPEDVSVASLKRDIERIFDLEPEEQVLFFNGEQLIGEENGGFHHNGTIYVFKTYNLWLRAPTGQYFSLTVHQNMTIGSLKPTLYLQYGVDISNTRLKIPTTTNVFLDDRLTLKDAGIIRENDRLYSAIVKP